MDKATFILTFSKLAQQNYEKEKILPSLVIAQAILESGWGESGLSKSYNNFFGLKWYNDDVCRGYRAVNCRTGEEYTVGVITPIDALFCAFDSIEQCVECLYKWYRRPHYEPLHEATNYKDACRIVKECGYATSSRYTSSLIRVIEENNLAQYDVTSPHYYYVQIGAYEVLENAKRKKVEAEKKGIKATVKKCAIEGKVIYRVQVGAYEVEANAYKMKEFVKSKGYTAYVTTEGGTEVV